MLPKKSVLHVLITIKLIYQFVGILFHSSSEDNYFIEATELP